MSLFWTCWQIDIGHFPHSVFFCSVIVPRNQPSRRIEKHIDIAILPFHRKENWEYGQLFTTFHFYFSMRSLVWVSENVVVGFWKRCFKKNLSRHCYVSDSVLLVCVWFCFGFVWTCWFCLALFGFSWVCFVFGFALFCRVVFGFVGCVLFGFIVLCLVLFGLLGVCFLLTTVSWSTCYFTQINKFQDELKHNLLVKYMWFDWEIKHKSTHFISFGRFVGLVICFVVLCGNFDSFLLIFALILDNPNATQQHEPWNLPFVGLVKLRSKWIWD